jgi:hypothetical protein
MSDVFLHASCVPLSLVFSASACFALRPPPAQQPRAALPLAAFCLDARHAKCETTETETGGSLGPGFSLPSHFSCFAQTSRAWPRVAGPRPPRRVGLATAATQVHPTRLRLVAARGHGCHGHPPRSCRFGEYPGGTTCGWHHLWVAPLGWHPARAELELRGARGGGGAGPGRAEAEAEAEAKLKLAVVCSCSGPAAC